ncbi:MAG: MFS transporter [Planctomycetales bacterium]|nr:MFS transporter [Planctomycetales bacterium]
MSKAEGGAVRAPNAHMLLWAGFLAILAAGVGFSIRSGIVADLKREFGFSDTQFGNINGAGLTGFCFGIIIGGIVVDKIGYRALVIAAFVMHVLSAVVTFAAAGQESEMAYQFLYWGSFIFAVANGTLEAVANPLVATLFPDRRTHYLNILHASWPAGLVLGGMVGWYLGGTLEWKYQLMLFLVPTVLYGVLFIGQRFPKSEAAEAGVPYADMFKDVGLLGGAVVCVLLALFLGGIAGTLLPLLGSLSPSLEISDQWIGRISTGIGFGIGGLILIGLGILTRFSIGSVLLFVLFITHALVGAVELGTDGWIQGITGNLLTEGQGKLLFVYTSAIMFGLRFCAHFIETKLGLSPVALLFVCAVLACVGLNLASMIESFGMALLALGVYALGKTFFWPTMLAVASDRFPRSGAVAISIMGGIGMLSAGMLGSPGLGYLKDKYSSEELQAKAPVAYEQYQNESENTFLWVFHARGLDAKKMEAELNKLKDELKTAENLTDEQVAARVPELMEKLSEDNRAARAASIKGDRQTLRMDAVIPGTMAVIYLLLMLYFKSVGGYRKLEVEGDEHRPAADPAGGVTGEM